MSDSAQMRLVNRSMDLNRSDVVLFQRNACASGREDPIAWMVIRACPVDWTHPFSYSRVVRLAVRDFQGRLLGAANLEPGGAARVAVDPRFGPRLETRPGPDRRIAIVENHCPRSAVTAELYRSDRLVYRTSVITPGGRVEILLPDELVAVATKGIREGEPIPSGELRWRPSSRLRLFGVAEADILMRGGGYGASALPLRFELDCYRRFAHA